MKAVFIQEHGGPEVLTYGELPDPAVRDGSVKVRVKAGSLNRLDVYTRAGVRGMRREFPPALVLGGDCAGEVAEVGGGVQGLSAGDRVVVNPNITCGDCSLCLAGEDDLCPALRMLGSAVDGSYAEYVVVPAPNVHRIADHVSYEDAAAFPTTFLPMWNMLVRRGGLRPWETVLVLSASAGVGAAAIQVAKNVIGARVIATTSTDEKARKARELGADEVIVYSREDIRQRVKQLTEGRGVNVVVDHVGADFWPAASASLAPGGRYGICGVTTGYQVDLQMGLLFLRNQTVFGVFMGRKEDLRQIVELAGKGVIRSVIHETFPLRDAGEAHSVMESQSLFGKLILKP
jgi:NADPH:quinone reductase-like Zn-dependent oxidoreductase